METATKHCFSTFASSLRKKDFPSVRIATLMALLSGMCWGMFPLLLFAPATSDGRLLVAAATAIVLCCGHRLSPFKGAAIAFLASDDRSAEFTLPQEGGGYRLFAFVRDGHGGAAVANIPLFVKGPVALPKARKIHVASFRSDEVGETG